MRTSYVLAAPLLVFAAAGPSQAGEFSTELKLGGLAHDVNPRFVNGEPSLFGNHKEEASLDVNVEVLFPPFRPFLGGMLRPAVGGTVNTAGATNHVYADLRWQYEMPSHVFFALGVGAAYHDGNLGVEDPNRRALGSRVLFHIPVEAGLRLDEHNSVSLYWEHTSNAGLVYHFGFGEPYNEGMDRIGVRYGYQF